MKTIAFCILATFISVISFAQQPKVLVFKHELRWTDETKFPNYFLMPAVRDSIFSNAKLALIKYLKVPDIKFPADVEYKIYPGFAKPQVELPKNNSGNDPVVGLFSLITRATTGYAMFWKFNIIIKQNNKVILEKEVNHEIEFFNPSGYVTSQQWVSPEQFTSVLNRLIKEVLGELPATNEKIILGSLETEEARARSLFPASERYLFKINGAWRTAGNFSALLESAKDTVFKFNFREGLQWSLAVPTLSSVLASTFREVTGINFPAEQKIINQKSGTLTFDNGNKFGITLKWIEFVRQALIGDEITSRISDPLVAEVYDQKVQSGYFLYTRWQNVNSTAKTKESFNAFTGPQTENTLGIEKMHRVDGSLYKDSITAEYNESKGIISIKSGNQFLCALVVQNCNPESRSVGGAQLSKNKVFMTGSGQNMTKPSMDKVKFVEWYPVYFPLDASDFSRKACIEALMCLFFGMGNM